MIFRVSVIVLPTTETTYNNLTWKEPIRGKVGEAPPGWNSLEDFLEVQYLSKLYFVIIFVILFSVMIILDDFDWSKKSEPNT